MLFVCVYQSRLCFICIYKLQKIFKKNFKNVLILLHVRGRDFVIFFPSTIVQYVDIYYRIIMSGIKERIKCVSLEVILSFQDVKSHRGGEIKVGHHYQYMYNFYRGPNDKHVPSFFTIFMILVLSPSLRNMAIICPDSKHVPLVVGTAVDILLLCGVLPYGVNLLGVNLCDSLDLNV